MKTILELISKHKSVGFHWNCAQGISHTWSMTPDLRLVRLSAPQCRMLTPVFHPNFDDSSVCIGDFWAASEGLDDLVIRIGRMIAYQEYNTKSPLNGLAAKWAAQNAGMLPIDARVISPPGTPLAGGPPAEQASAIATPAPAAEISLPAPGAAEVETSMQASIGFAKDAAEDLPDDPWAEKIVIDA